MNEYEKRKERFDKALELAEREWNNVAESLSDCGDIGAFDKEDFMIGIIDEDVIIKEPMWSKTKGVSGYAPTYYPMYFLQNLLAMDENLEKRGYKTVEALYVFIEIAAKAVERLGFRGTFSIAFATGYAYCRTGWMAEKAQSDERDIFYAMFFPPYKFFLGHGDYSWGFHWTSVREKLKRIFDRFMSWQNDPALYRSEVKPKAKTVPMMV